MKNITFAFQMQGVGEYFKNKQHCINNRQWSEVVVANIASSIKYNLEPSYVTLNNVEKNCAKFFKTLHSTIYTTEKTLV